VQGIAARHAIIVGSAPVAQLDRAIASGAIGREFESLRARQKVPSDSSVCLRFADFDILFDLSLCPILCPPSLEKRRVIQHAIRARLLRLVLIGCCLDPSTATV
jgi:hypothetical protein